jgi:hypothetical protein
MRTIHSFVLRVLADADEPESLRGSLRPVSGEAEYPFADGHGLLALLIQLVKPNDETAKGEIEKPEAQAAHADHG